MKRASLFICAVSALVALAAPASAATGTATIAAIYAFAGSARVDVQFTSSIGAGCSDAAQLSMDTSYMSVAEIDRLVRLFHGAYLAGRPVQVNTTGCTAGSNLAKLVWANF